MLDLSTQNTRSFEAPDGSRWQLRPLTSWEKAAWISQTRAANMSADAAVTVFRNPVCWAAVGWEGVKDEAGKEVPFPAVRQLIPSVLDRVSPNVLIVVSFEILNISHLLGEERVKSESAPSPTPAS